MIDAGELWENFKEYINWKNTASNNIAILKSIIKNRRTLAHDHIFIMICEVRVEDLSQNVPLCNSIIDLNSDKYQLLKNNHIDLVI